MENKYTFKEQGHRHLLNGKPLTGITTVLGVIAKPALINWSAGVAVDYIDNALKEQIADDNEGNLLEWFGDNWEQVKKEAKVAHTKKKEEAGQAGTDVHAIIEKIIKEAIEKNNGIIENVLHEVPQVQRFLEWVVNNNVKFIESEKHCYSANLWLGGICDFVCIIDDKRCIGDLKTSSNIYPENLLQISTYDLMLQEMGEPKSEIGIILNLRKDGSFLEKRTISFEENQQAFLSCLNIYRTLEKIKNTIL